MPVHSRCIFRRDLFTRGRIMPPYDLGRSLRSLRLARVIVDLFAEHIQNSDMHARKRRCSCIGNC